ncbi:MAG: 2,3-bisphosphoglycerate-independent phosphoglycerate mutase [Candidatus Cloacimonadota bacterium]|nr:2,3-bisphosphoglycerate-independent phosphoglycerate mutase [Candidatus Cloacimonadota bacterium]
MMENRVLLLILDGFGISKEKKGNAIKAAFKPNIDKFFNENPHSTLHASGKHVGLPEGIMGNSEVGHLNIGAGRVVYQLNTLIDKKIETGEFYENSALNNAIKHVKKNNSKLHLFGLLSDGNVHSNIKHLWALLNLAKTKGIEQVYLHAFMDGRDTLPHSGKGFIKQFQEKAKELGVGKIASISGRYYAMDRDNRWDRTEKAYRTLVEGKGEKFNDPIEAVQKSYNNDITDEFIFPLVITEKGKPVATIEDGDSIVFFNFRADRARQISRSFFMPNFDKFERKNFQNLKYVTFSEYDIKFNDYTEIAFRPKPLTNILGKVIADAGKKQLRLAETEKYAHVTFFFNGGVEKKFKNEDRLLVPSPQVATYDKKPEMSAFEVKDKLVESLYSQKYDLIITNFANCDMVGHTGDFKATVKAVEAVDKCVGEVVHAAKKSEYNIVLIADHGNAEKMLDEDDNIFTAHTTNLVPVVVSKVYKEKKYKVNRGKLADVAPTILKLMQLKKSKEMTGKALI